MRTSILAITILLLARVAISAEATEGIDFDLQDPYMNARYQKGEYLLYDCKGSYWVCTHKFEFDRCQKHRDFAIDDLNPELPCAYFRKYKDRDTCLAKQTELTNQNHHPDFCVNKKYEGEK